MSKKETRTKARNEKDHALPSLALVFGYIAVKELNNISDKVRVLARLGYGNQEMATICDTTPPTIAVVKSGLKKKKKTRKGAAGGHS